jgi:hypothetical protein
MTTLDAYFRALAAKSRELLDRLPIERTPQPLEHTLTVLSQAVRQAKPAELRALRALRRPAAAAPVRATGVGLNTVGMLTDRFTILVLKEWALRNKGERDAAKADELFRGQTLDIVEALAASRPGSASLNSKITRITASAQADDWDEAYWGLFTTNLLIWESQEMLYVRDIAAAPCEELRSYIDWFSRSNIERNAYIELCEKRFWQASAASTGNGPR